MAFFRKSRRPAKGPDRDDPDDLFALLERDHRAVRGLLEQAHDTIDDDPEGARLLVAEATIQLLAHARGEERTLYPALERHRAATDLALEGREEHAVLESLVGKLAAARTVDATFKAKLKVLTEILDHHVDEEEEQMFPEAREVLGAERLTAIAAAFIAEKQAELARLSLAATADNDEEPVILGVD